MTDPNRSSHPLHVFLCHSSADKPAVRELYQRLRADGFEPWLDEEDLIPGQDWQREIPRAVRKSDAVIVCLSHNSVKAGYIQKEIKFALDVADEQSEDTIFIIPLKLEECKVPDRLSRWQWVNYFSENGYRRLLRALRTRVGALEAGTAIPHAKEPPVESHAAVQPSSEIANQFGGIKVDAEQVNVGQDVVGRDKVIQEGDKVSGDKFVQYIEHYHTPSNPQETVTNVQLSTKSPDLSNRAFMTVLGVTILLGLLMGVPLVYNLFFAPKTNSSAILAPSPTSTNLRRYTVQTGDTISKIAQKFNVSVDDIEAVNNLLNSDILSEGQVLLIPDSSLMPTPTPTSIPTPTPVPIPTSTRAPLPVITGTASTALGDFFVTIREIKSPGNLAGEQVILTNLSGQVNMVGWTMTDGEGNQFTFPSLSLLSTGEVTVHTGKGTNTPTDLYWGQTEPRWASGKVAYLRDLSGNLIATYQVP